MRIYSQSAHVCTNVMYLSITELERIVLECFDKDLSSKDDLLGVVEFDLTSAQLPVVPTW
jgi:hypothetical protein